MKWCFRHICVNICKYALIVLCLVLITGIYCCILFFLPVNLKRLNLSQRYITNTINSTWREYTSTISEDSRSQLDYDCLISQLNPIQKDLVLRILAHEPERFGFRGAFTSTQPAKDLIRLKNITFEANQTGTISIETGIEYLPKHVYKDYLSLNKDMKNDINLKVYVDSGYRSAGRQLFLFFKYLQSENNYSLTENAKWIAFPGYSQHNDPVSTAVDFITSKGINGASFEAEPEYQWLVKKAERYNFYLSYPINNPSGISFEAWHWQWIKKRVS